MALFLAFPIGSCGKNEAEKKVSSSPSADAQSESPSSRDSDPDDGICDKHERQAAQRKCDGNSIEIIHADRACSSEGITTHETIQCFKYQQVLTEPAGFTYIQKGVCSDASGTPLCVLDSDYHCPDTTTKKEECYEGYKISYWHFASCGPTVVEKDSADCLSD